MVGEDGGGKKEEGRGFFYAGWQQTDPWYNWRKFAGRI